MWRKNDPQTQVAGDPGVKDLPDRPTKDKGDVSQSLVKFLSKLMLMKQLDHVMKHNLSLLHMSS